MQQKNHYNTLQVHAGASAAEIKKAYRKLALQFHPDKNNNSKTAEIHFNEIKEAYEILSDKKKRDAYNYERYSHARSFSDKDAGQLVTPAWILQQSTELKKKISRADPYRVDRDGLLFQVQYLLSEYNLGLLEEAPEETNTAIIDALLAASKPLTPDKMNKTALLLVRVAGSNNQLIEKINAEINERKWHYLWQKNKFFIAILFAVLLCLMIRQLKT